MTEIAPNKAVIVGLSGGVDSSVTAMLLSKASRNVEAMFMKNWIDIHGDEQCPIAEDLEDARRVSETLAIPFHSVNFAPEYWDRVFRYFLDEYKAGRTPNPDVLCNKEIKFKVFLNKAKSLGADYIATGHYARILYKDGYFRLYRALDLNKDQSYFLYTLGQEQLSQSLFPLGSMQKPEVRKLAYENNLVTHDKKDSTGICFIGERNFSEFLSDYLPAQPGNMETPEGKLIGTHNGLMFYTLGQRKGLKIGGRQDADEDPWYVVGKKIAENVLVIAQGHDHPYLYSDTLHATQLHWTTDKIPTAPFHCAAKTRYRQPDQACSIVAINQDSCTVVFKEPQRAVTPGQSVVFYQGDECLGGGIINHVEKIIYQ